MNRHIVLTALSCLAAAGFVLAQSVVGSFKYVKENDPLSDEDRSYLWTQETSNPKRAAQLQVRCQANSRTRSTDLYIALEHNLELPQYYTSYATVRWQYRFDKNPASSNWLSYFGEDGTRLYIADEARQDFVRDAKRAARLVVVVTGDDLAAQTYTFNLTEFPVALQKLKCSVQPR